MPDGQRAAPDRLRPPRDAPVEDGRTKPRGRVSGAQGLWRNGLFKQVVQAVLELAKPGTDERATLEYVQNHLAADGGVV